MTPGFTLIELVVVIAIVAATTAAVIPRVWAWQRAARIGNLTAARGAVVAAATLVHAKALARAGAPDEAPCAGGGTADNRLEGAGTVCTESGLVGTRHGWPASLAPGAGAGILGAAGFGAQLPADAAQLAAQGYRVSVDGPVTRVARADAPDPAQCRFTYTEAPAARSAAYVSPLVVAGC